MDERLTCGSLFSGVGGFDLGLERAGMRVVWQCEQNQFCRRVLTRHWPGVPCHPDVRTLVADTDGGRQQERSQLNGGAPSHTADGRSRREHADGHDDPAGAGIVPVPVPRVDVLCGGFPCQDLSYAGRGAGLAGERSGLWREFARLIGELRPRYVLVENVPALTSRGLDVVLADLAACGFDAEWDHLPASAFGAPHRRDRLWLVAYPQSGGRVGWPHLVGRDDHARGEAERREGAGHATRGDTPPRDRGDVAYADGSGRGDEADERRPLDDAVRGRHGAPEGQVPAGRNGALDTDRRQLESGVGDLAHGLPIGLGGHWDREPDITRVAVGVPQRVDRLRALGNALVPQIAEWIGRQIVEWEAAA